VSSIFIRSSDEGQRLRSSNLKQAVGRIYNLPRPRPIQLLHDADILHCDINPKNFLLDAQLQLKIADFGGSSLAGSKPSACSGPRFILPDRWRDPPTVQDDLFALGTTIYFIMTSKFPFPGFSEDEIEENYRNGKFPDVSGIVCGEFIKRCWTSQIASARELYNFVI